MEWARQLWFPQREGFRDGDGGGDDDDDDVFCGISYSTVSIWDALEKAGKTALDASSGATVSIVHHKYSAEAAKTVSQGLSMGTDLYSVSTNLR